MANAVGGVQSVLSGAKKNATAMVAFVMTRSVLVFSATPSKDEHQKNRERSGIEIVSG